MARVSRVVAPGVPHHITQRGNRRQRTFFREEDFRLYKTLMAHWCAFNQVEIWAYCLMPNHVHLIALPSSAASLRLAIGEAHRRYSAKINKREGWTGHLWQGRFFSYPMDESHLIRSANYILLNPVRAGLCERAEDYPWSSAKALATGSHDNLIKGHGLAKRIRSWPQFSEAQISGSTIDAIQLHERTGRPLGSDNFVDRLESELGRTLRYKKKGRKRSLTIEKMPANK